MKKHQLSLLLVALLALVAGWATLVAGETAVAPLSSSSALSNRKLLQSASAAAAGEKKRELFFPRRALARRVPKERAEKGGR